MSKTIVYLRVSGNSQDTENQKFGVIAFCTAKNFTVDEWLVDIMSGATEGKDRKIWPAVQKLQRGDTLIISEISRIGRESLHIMEVLKYCKDHGINVHAVKEGFEMQDNIMSKIMGFFYAISAEMERERISERTREALARKKAEGAILGRKKGSFTGTLRINAEGVVTSKFERQKNKIVEFINEGKNNTQIAKEIGATRERLGQYIKQNNLRAA